MHPVDIAPQGIDFTVVGHVAIGVRPLPTGEGIGAEARMHQTQGTLHLRILKVWVILAHLLGHQHALIDQGATGHTGGIPIGINARHANGGMAALADHIEFAIEAQIIAHISTPLNEHLLHEGLARLGGFPKGGVVGGDIPPPQHRLPFFCCNFLENGATGLAGLRIRGSVDHAYAVLSRFRQGHPRCSGHLRHKAMGHLNQNARPVTGIGLCPHCPPMVQIQQDSQGLIHNAVGGFALHLHNKTHTAGIVFESWIV